ncbi:ribonuclease H-like domain-containing protein [Tanacetum coccineum]
MYPTGPFQTFATPASRFTGKKTTLPHAFAARTSHDPTTDAWNMDTGASSHLNNSNLIYVHQCVHDNNCTIEFDAFGFSVKDFLTRRVLLRCDNTGDLYPVTSPSPIPDAFLVSQHTWHERLGYPGGEVLRRLVSSNFISCNKEKHPILCDACQLGKHMKLPFVSSDTVINSCFDIIYSDVWTSPILSLLVTRPPDIVRCIWLFRYKYLADGTLSRYKARLVANGSTQLEGVNVDETFSMVVKPAVSSWAQASPSGLGIDTTYLLLYVDDITHADTESKLGVDGDPVSDPTLYRSLAGSLQYHTFTRLYISYAIQQLFSSSTTDLVAYSDADWVGCLMNQRSTSGAEAEYRDVAKVVAGTCLLRNLLRELHTPLSFATLVYCDNVSAVYLSSNLVQHQRTNHIEIDIHFVRDLVVVVQVRVLHVPSHYQFADIFTKGLLLALFEDFRTSLSV